MPNVLPYLPLVAKNFQKSFNDAKEFNTALKSGKDLKFAPVITEDKKEEKKAEETTKSEEKKEEK